MGPQSRPGEVITYNAPQTLAGGETARCLLPHSWPFRPRTHQTQIIFHGAAYDYSYLLVVTYVLNNVSNI